MILRQLVYFSSRIVKDAILQAVLFLDLAGIVISYSTNFHLPLWFLAGLPTLAVFTASFNVYRQGASDIRLEFVDDQVSFECEGGHGDICYEFKTTLFVQAFNYGAQSGSIQNVSYHIGINGIMDEFVLSSMGISYTVSDFCKGHDKFDFKAEVIPMPIVLPPGHIEPLCIHLRLTLPLSEVRVERMIQWLRYVDFRIDYKMTQNGGPEQASLTTELSTRSIRAAAAVFKEKEKRFAKRVKDAGFD